MFNMNSGYSGWSMSKRAADAYEDGARPKSKWTKAAMMDAIVAYMVDDMELPDAVIAVSVGAIRKMTKSEMFMRFFFLSEWHHTSKFCNATDFYRLDDQELCEFLFGEYSAAQDESMRDFSRRFGDDFQDETKRRYRCATIFRNSFGGWNYDASLCTDDDFRAIVTEVEQK